MADLLIVEDDAALREAMLELLSMKGHRVRHADSGVTALAVIETNPPELIISDVKMPAMTGTELLEAVRARTDWRRIPFLFISASTAQHTERELDAMRGVSFLRKPFAIETLYDAIGRALGDNPVDAERFFPAATL